MDVRVVGRGTAGTNRDPLTFVSPIAIVATPTVALDDTLPIESGVTNISEGSRLVPDTIWLAVIFSRTREPGRESHVLALPNLLTCW